MAGIFNVTMELTCVGDETGCKDTMGVAAENATEAIAKAKKYFEDALTTEDEQGNPLPKAIKTYSRVELLEVKLAALADI